VLFIPRGLRVNPITDSCAIPSQLPLHLGSMQDRAWGEERPLVLRCLHVGNSLQLCSVLADSGMGPHISLTISSSALGSKVLLLVLFLLLSGSLPVELCLSNGDSYSSHFRQWLLSWCQPWFPDCTSQMGTTCCYTFPSPQSAS
jgi:hypothetical protein